MPFRLVKGEVALFKPPPKPANSKPDGDTVWFKPDDLSLLTDFNGRSVKPNKSGYVGLRLEGIDALETHVQVVGGIEHQLLERAFRARDRLLKGLGFSSVTYGENEQSVVYSSPTKVKAHIFTRSLDTHYRPISFLLPGSTSKADGSDVFLTVAQAGQSVNAELMQDGFVYPLYYDTLPPDIRDHFTELVTGAFNAGDELWDGADTTNEFNKVTSLADLRELAVWPKLYRRLADYFARVPSGNLKKFDEALRNGTFSTLKDDRLDIVSADYVELNANMHDVYELNGTNKIRMKYFPEEIIVTGD